MCLTWLSVVRVRSTKKWPFIQNKPSTAKLLPHHLLQESIQYRFYSSCVHRPSKKYAQINTKSLKPVRSLFHPWVFTPKKRAKFCQIPTLEKPSHALMIKFVSRVIISFSHQALRSLILERLVGEKVQKIFTLNVNIRDNNHKVNEMRLVKKTR